MIREASLEALRGIGNWRKQLDYLVIELSCERIRNLFAGALHRLAAWLTKSRLYAVKGRVDSLFMLFAESASILPIATAKRGSPRRLSNERVVVAYEASQRRFKRRVVGACSQVSDGATHLPFTVARKLNERLNHAIDLGFAWSCLSQPLIGVLNPTEDFRPVF
jgi:hypothetical protein